MSLNDWWADVASERYWMEVTRRTDFGEDLHGTEPDPGKSIPRRETMTYTRPGDVVLHWDMAQKALIGYSVVDSYAASDAIGHAGEWVVALRSTEFFENPIDMDALNSCRDEVLAAQEVVRAEYEGPLYLAFDLYGARIRPAQGYLSKVPSAVVDVLNGLLKDAIPDIFIAASVLGGASTRGSVTGAKSSTKSGAGGGGARRRIVDAVVRVAIEMHAVRLAIDHYYAEGATDVEVLGKPFDLRVTLPSGERRVEVKGSTSARLTAVELTRNEVDHARSFLATDLFVVDQIQYAKDSAGVVRTDGGRVRIWPNWAPANRALTPSRFDYLLPLEC